MNVLGRLRARLTKELRDRIELDAKLERESLLRQLERSEAERDRLRQTKDDFFKLIESMQEERDWWRESFYTQSREHQTAQAMLVRALERSGRLCMTLQNALNTYRKRHDQPLVKLIERSPKPPTDAADNFKQAMEQLAELQPEPVDAVELRDRIVGKSAQAS